jgi:hypothetical protein
LGPAAFTDRLFSAITPPTILRLAEGRAMRAEIEKLTAETQQSLALLRRYL